MKNENELKKMQRASLLKMIVIAVIVVVFVVFSSVAWFTMNREVEGAGVQMRATGENFTISSLSGENTSKGLWYDPYHKKIMGESDTDDENDSDASSHVWRMTAEANLGNFQNDNQAEEVDGIKPGSFGKVTFNVTPLVDQIDLQFTFDVIGYHSSDSVIDQNNENSENTPLTLTPVADMGTKGADIAGYLNGHILLFENRTPVYETITVTDPENEEKITTNTNKILRYIYSGLITTNEDMNRVLKNTEKTHFTGKDTVTPVDIYWI